MPYLPHSTGANPALARFFSSRCRECAQAPAYVSLVCPSSDHAVCTRTPHAPWPCGPSSPPSCACVRPCRHGRASRGGAGGGGVGGRASRPSRNRKSWDSGCACAARKSGRRACSSAGYVLCHATWTWTGSESASGRPFGGGGPCPCRDSATCCVRAPCRGCPCDACRHCLCASCGGSPGPGPGLGLVLCLRRRRRLGGDEDGGEASDSRVARTALPRPCATESGGSSAPSGGPATLSEA